jgi:hypothetical protein
MKWPKLLLGRLFLRFCQSVRRQPQVPGCDCVSATRCPLYSFCRAAKLESSAAGRLEKVFWVIMIAVTGCWALYALLPDLFALL